jgi:hypothetical protein
MKGYAKLALMIFGKYNRKKTDRYIELMIQVAKEGQNERGR